MIETGYEATVLHTAFEKKDPYGALNMPVYQTAAYEFASAEEMEEAFCGRSSDYAYSRISNPTVHYFEERVRQITGAHSVTAFGTGMAAISNALLCLTYAGCNIVTSAHLFGNTWSFMVNTLGAYGVEVRFCDLTDPEALKAHVDDHTAVVFLEAITNPQLEIADLRALSDMAHSLGVPLMVDSTIVPFTHFNAREQGVDIEVVSSTKYISGGATSLGGLILDYATFDWSKSPRLSALSESFGTKAFTAKLRKEIHRNLGACMVPQVASLQSLGLETLALRYERQTNTCLELARMLKTIPLIESVNYPGLDDNHFHEVACRQFGGRPGAMLTFDLIDRTHCFRMMNKLNLIRRATNLFDNKTLAIHPASTIYGTFTDEQRRDMDVSQQTIRLSVGLESAQELYQDILQALQC